MSIRTTSSTVRFSRPFALAGIADEQPAGSYTLEMDEELLQNVSFPAYRRISTRLRLPPRPGSTELARIVELEPLELASLLASDVNVEDQPVAIPSAVATDRRQTTGHVRERVTTWKDGWRSLRAWVKRIEGPTVLPTASSGLPLREIDDR